MTICLIHPGVGLEIECAHMQCKWVHCPVLEIRLRKAFQSFYTYLKFSEIT